MVYSLTSPTSRTVARHGPQPRRNVQQGGHQQGVDERQAREASSNEFPHREAEHGSDEHEEPNEDLKAQGHRAIGAHHREVGLDVPDDGHHKLGERLLLLMAGTDGRQAVQTLPELLEDQRPCNAVKPSKFPSRRVAELP